MDYRMTRAEFVDFMNRFEKEFREAEAAYDRVSDIITPEFFYSHNYLMLMLELFEKSMGSGETIHWWVFETDFGEKKDLRKVSWTDLNGVKHKMTINNAADLYDYIMVD